MSSPVPTRYAIDLRSDELGSVFDAKLPNYRSLYLTALTFALAILVFAGTVRFPIGVTVFGSARYPNSVPVIAPFSGYISQVINDSQDGVVAEGSPVLRLSRADIVSSGKPQADEERRYLANQLDEVHLGIARAKDNQISYKERVDELVRDISEQITATSDSVMLSKQLLDLEKRGFNRLLNLADLKLESNANVSVARGRVLAAERNIADGRREVSALQERRRSALLEHSRWDWDNDRIISELNRTLALLKRDLIVDDRLREAPVLMPFSGKAQFNHTNLGKSVERGDLLFHAIPGDTQLEFIANVAPRDIGKAVVGTEVKIEIIAFPLELNGTITGRIAEVPALPTNLAGETVGSTEELVYEVVVTPVPDSLDLFLQKHTLRSGMTTRTRIVSYRSTLLSLFLRPLQRLFE